MDKYCDVEKVYKSDIDNWLCNLFFSIARKDELANPYSVQLILDEDTQKRYEESLSREAILANAKSATKHDDNLGSSTAMLFTIGCSSGPG